ncbi:MAG TPA: hypothetical protein VGS11_10575 [Candidatus Bathyarchaeia archaeon]|nr:hypothetical protein [Candidatus Bathyarchaeia archaeon]
MKRVYLLAIISVVIVAGIATSLLIYEASQNTRPPQVVLVYLGNTYSGAPDNYCWPKPPANGTCTDPLNVGPRTDVPPPISVANNSSVTFQVSGSSNPSNYSVAIWTKSNGSSTVLALKHVTSSLPISLQAGNYYLSVFAVWNDGRGVGYTFEITVSA